MELAYRIAVDESPFVKAIRENAITLITPILEVDGRDKQVDVAMAKRKDPKANVPNRLLYWGKYVSHDNNRDNLGLALKLSQHVMKVFLDFHPLVMHDLHESISFLYISTGTGPYNAWLDPITVDEWNLLAYREVNEHDQGGRPRRLDARLLRRLGPQLRLLRGQRPQRHRPVLRDPGRRRRLDPGHRRVRRPGLVQAQPAAEVGPLVHPQQRQPPAERRPHRHEPRRHGQGQVPGELLPQEQALGRQGPRRRPGRLRLPRRRPSPRSAGPPAPAAPGPGRRGPQGRQALQGQGRRVSGRQLRRPHGPALFAHGRHDARPAVLQRQRPRALRRRRLDARPALQRQDRPDRGGRRARRAHDPGQGRGRGARRRRAPGQGHRPGLPHQSQRRQRPGHFPLRP